MNRTVGTPEDGELQPKQEAPDAQSHSPPCAAAAARVHAATAAQRRGSLREQLLEASSLAEQAGAHAKRATSEAAQARALTAKLENVIEGLLADRHLEREERWAKAAESENLLARSLSPEALLPPENLRSPQSSSAPEMRVGIQYEHAAGLGPGEGDEQNGLHGSRRRLLGLRKGRPFIDYPGKCAVCGLKLKVADKQALRESGWALGLNSGLCPDCQTSGWVWSEGADLPLRRSVAPA